MYAMVKQCLPVFSGNINDYKVNYLLELDLIKRLAVGNDVCKVSLGLSPRRGQRSPRQEIPYSDNLYQYL